MRVWLKPTIGKLFFWQKHVFRVTPTEKKEVFIDVPIESERRAYSDKWEEDMINGFLDGFKGTDMKMISRIEY